jgi:hypothetical protein
MPNVCAILCQKDMVILVLEMKSRVMSLSIMMLVGLNACRFPSGLLNEAFATDLQVC